MHAWFACMYLCTSWMPGAHRGQKKALDLRELELQMVVSFQVGAKNRTWVLCKSSTPALQPQENLFIFFYRVALNLERYWGESTQTSFKSYYPSCAHQHSSSLLVTFWISVVNLSQSMNEYRYITYELKSMVNSVWEDLLLVLSILWVWTNGQDCVHGYTILTNGVNNLSLLVH